MPWPNSTRAAIVLTMDNMGEAADLHRGLHPASSPIGSHPSVTTALPKMLMLLGKHKVKATYFVEAWNLSTYRSVLADSIVRSGHELAWHAWQHEAWGKLDAEAERRNFERSFGEEGLRSFLDPIGDKARAQMVYRGFRPPGGIVHGERTFDLCDEFGVGYISPAGEKAAEVTHGSPGGERKLVVLPFKWSTVDAYYYMETFAGLREIKGVYSKDVQDPDTLVKSYLREIDDAIERGGYLSLLFHPFLTNTPERLAALEKVLEYLAEKRRSGDIWLTQCWEVEQWIRDHPEMVGSDPGWDNTEWR